MVSKDIQDKIEKYFETLKNNTLKIVNKLEKEIEMLKKRNVKVVTIGISDPDGRIMDINECYVDSPEECEDIARKCIFDKDKDACKKIRYNEKLTEICQELEETLGTLGQEVCIMIFEEYGIKTTFYA